MKYPIKHWGTGPSCDRRDNSDEATIAMEDTLLIAMKYPINIEKLVCVIRMVKGTMLINMSYNTYNFDQKRVMTLALTNYISKLSFCNDGYSSSTFYFVFVSFLLFFFLFLFSFPSHQPVL